MKLATELTNNELQTANCKLSVAKSRSFVRLSFVALLMLGILVFSNNVNAQQTNVTISGSATSGGTWSASAPWVFTPNVVGSGSANILNTDIQNRLLGSGFTSGSVTINTANATGTGNGDITVSTSITAANTTTSLTTTTTLTLNAGRFITINQPIDLAANSTANPNNTARAGFNITLSAGSDIFVSAAISTSGITRGNPGGNGAAAGNITLTSTTGKVSLTAALTANGSATSTSSSTGGAGGAIAITGTGGITSTSSGTITTNGGNASGTTSTGGAGGAITISDGLVATTAGTNDGLLGTITGAGGTGTTAGNPSTLTKNGTGTLILNAANTYAGATIINAGVLNIRNATATGTTAGGVTVTSGAALEIQGGITVGAEVLSLAGTGVSGNGAFRNISGTNTWQGTITQTSASVIQSDAGSIALSAANSITGTHNLTLQGAGAGTISGTITIGTGTLTKEGAGTWTLAGANTYTGGTTITSGTLTLGAAGVLANAGNVTLNGGTLRTGATNGFSETVNTLNLSAPSTIALGTGAHTLTFANSSGVSWTSTTLTITGWSGTGGATGTAGKIFFGATTGTLTGSQLAMISFTGFSCAPILLNTGELVPAQGDAGTASSTPTLCINTALTNITHSTTLATGISNAGVSGANGLPAGVSATWASNVITISGTPTVAGVFNYSITLTGACGNATGTITVSQNTAGTPSSTPSICVNTALTAITIATTGATGISNSGVSGANGLPTGVSATWASNTITISGTPTTGGVFNYSIPLTGGCGSVNATGTITVNNDVTNLTASATSSQCTNAGVVVTLSSSLLTSGTYSIDYKFNDSGATYTATGVTFTAGSPGTGTFTTVSPSSSDTRVTIKSVSRTSPTCSSSTLTINTNTFTTSAPPNAASNNLTTTASGTDTGNVLGSTVNIVSTQLIAGTYTVGYTITNTANTITYLTSSASITFTSVPRRNNRIQGSFYTGQWPGIVAGTYLVNIISVTSPTTGCTTNITGESTTFSVVDGISTTGNGNGLWDGQGVWTSNINGGDGPNFTSGPININHPVTYDATSNSIILELDQLTIGNGGELIIASGQEFRLKNGTGVDITINAGGKLTIGSTTIAPGDTYNGTLVFEEATTHSGTSTTTVTFRTQSQYSHMSTTTEGAPPFATWAADATFEVIGYTSTPLTFASANWSQSFPNFTWNCTAQTADINLNGLLGTSPASSGALQNHVTITSTGTGILRFGNTTNYSLTIPGTFTVSNTARFSMGPNSGNNPILVLNVNNFNYNSSANSWLCEAGQATINVTGNIQLNSGTIYLSDGGNNLTQSGGTVNLYGDLTIANGATLDASSSNNNRTGLLAYTNTSDAAKTHLHTVNGYIIGYMQYSIGANQTVRAVNESPFYSLRTQAGTFTMATGTTLIVESTDAGGAIQAGTTAGNLRIAGTATARSFASGATIEYGRTSTAAGQFIGDGHPSTSVVDCRINNSSGVTVSSTGSTVLISGSLRIINGNLTVAENNVTVSQNIETTGGNIIVTPRASGTVTTALRADGAFNMTGGNIQMNSSATLNLANTSLLINGDLLGTNYFAFTGANCRVTIEGSTRTFTRDFPINTATTLEELIMNVAGTTLVIPQNLTLGNASTNDGGLTLTNGNIDMNANLLVTAVTTLTSGILYFDGPRTVELQRNINTAFPNGVFYSDASSTLNITSGFGGVANTLAFSPSGNTLGMLLLNRSDNATPLVTLNSALNISGTLNLTDGEFFNQSGLNMSSGATLIRTGQSTFASGSAIPTGGPYNVVYNDYVNGGGNLSATTINISSALELQGSINNVTSNLSGTATLTTALTGIGLLNVNNTGTQATTKTFNCSTFTAQMGSVLINSNATLIAPSSTNLTLNGTAPNNFTNNGTFTHNSGTVIFDGNSTIIGSATTFNHITLNDNRTLTFPPVIVVQGNINIGLGTTFNHSDGNVQLTGGNAQSISTSEVVTDQATPENGNAATRSATMHFYTITVNKSGNEVTLSTPLKLGHLLDIQSTTVVNTGTDAKLILLSQNDNTAYDARIGPILNGGSINGNVQVQRLKDVNINADFKYIGSPAANVPWMAEMWRLNKYNTSTGQWVKTYEDMTWGVGYAAQTYAGNVRLTFTGAVKTGDFGWTLATGWNLIANPYPSAIRWADLSNTNKWVLSSGVSNVIGITDNDYAGYPNYFRYLNGPVSWGSATIIGNVIATGQAFWVYSSTNGETITIKESAKVLDSDATGNFYRQRIGSVSKHLVLSINNGKMQDQTFLKIEENDKANQLESNLPKLWNPQMNIYLLGEGQKEMLTYTVSGIDKGTTIPLGLKVEEPGEFEISFSNSESFTEPLYLIDLYEGDAISVTSGQSHKIKVTDPSKPINDRFYLSLNPDIELDAENSVSIYPNPVKGALNIRVWGSKEVSHATLMDMNGKALVSADFMREGNINMENYSEGLYILKIRTTRGIITKKISKHD